jgi:hypothetical protein
MPIWIDEFWIVMGTVDDPVSHVADHFPRKNSRTPILTNRIAP